MKFIEDFDCNLINKNPLRIALVSPHQKITPKHVNLKPSNIPPLGLMSLMSSLQTNQKVQSRIFDASTYISNDDFIFDLKTYLLDGGILAIQTYTRIYEDIQSLCEIFSDKTVLKIFGGHFITAQPTFDAAHIVVRGYGEIPLKSIIELLLLPQIIWYENLLNEKGVSFISRQFGTNDNGINRVSINKIDYFGCGIDYNKYSPSSAYQFPNSDLPFYLLSSFGCTHSCSFCSSSIISPKKKSLPLREVISIINVAISKGHDYVQFWDDNFLHRPIKELNQILNRLHEARIPYSCLGRADMITDLKAKLLSETGCYRIFFGVETGDEELLNNYYNKQERIIDIKKAFSLIHNYNIKALCGFIIGARNESLSTIQKSLELAIELNPFALWFEPLSIDPGTKIFRSIKLPHNIPSTYFYGKEEPRGMPIISKIFSNNEQLSNDSIEVEKRNVLSLIKNLYKSFYLRQEHIEKYYNKGDCCEKKYLEGMYEILK